MINPLNHSTGRNLAFLGAIVGGTIIGPVTGGAGFGLAGAALVGLLSNIWTGELGQRRAEKLAGPKYAHPNNDLTHLLADAVERVLADCSNDHPIHKNWFGELGATAQKHYLGIARHPALEMVRSENLVFLFEQAARTDDNHKLDLLDEKLPVAGRGERSVAWVVLEYLRVEVGQKANEAAHTLAERAIISGLFAAVREMLKRNPNGRAYAAIQLDTNGEILARLSDLAQNNRAQLDQQKITSADVTALRKLLTQQANKLYYTGTLSLPDDERMAIKVILDETLASAETLARVEGKVDQVITTQADHSVALVDLLAAVDNIGKKLAQQQSNPNAPSAISPDDQRILDEARHSTDLRTRLAASVLRPDAQTDAMLARLRQKHEANEYELSMLEGKRWYFARPIPQFDKAIPCFDRAMHLRPHAVDTRIYAGLARNSARLGDIAAHQRRAIDIYEGTLKFVPPNSSDWAMAKTNLGNTWASLPTGDRATNLENAIACYTRALEVRTKAAFPADWAMAQNNLGAAWWNLPTGDRARNLETAIACYTRALEVRTKADFPADWAATQNNLGIAWNDLPTGDRAKNLQTAIDCYTRALEVRTQADFPAGWALTQNNLGNAWGNLPTGDRAKNLANAIACYTQALEVRTKDDFPADWAMTQNNLGAAWGDLSTGDRAKNLENAIDCYTRALEVRTQANFPAGWAMTQNNLGNAWGNLSTGDRAKNLESAIGCYTRALEVYTQADFPADWAMTQNNLGATWRNFSTGDRAKNLENAIACYTRALEVRTKADFPAGWATTQYNLATALADLAHQPNLPVGQDRCGLLRRAIACSKGALTVRTPDAFPHDHARTMKNMNIDRRAYEAGGCAEKAPFDDIAAAE
jgi:tetratricopeptide (TPR) repeat protein